MKWTSGSWNERVGRRAMHWVSETQKWCPYPEHQDKLPGFRGRHTKDSHCCLAQSIWKKWLDTSEHHFFYMWNGNKNTHLFTDKPRCYNVRKKWEASTHTRQMQLKSEGRLVISSGVQSLSCVRLSVTLWTTARQAPCPSLSPRVCTNPCPLSWWCHPTYVTNLVLCHPFSSCPQSFPASGSFPLS